MPTYPTAIINQLGSAFIFRSDMVAWLRAISEDFSGSAIDTRWTTFVDGTGVAASKALDSPTRITMSTGATCLSSTFLREGARTHWNVADKFSVIVRAKIDASAPATFFPIDMFASAQNRILLGFDSTVNTASYLLRTTSNSSTSNNALPVERDDQWHDFIISVHGTSRVRGRVDCDPTPYAESTSNIPTVDMEFRCGLNNRTSVNRQMDVDSIIQIPGLIMF